MGVPHRRLSQLASPNRKLWQTPLANRARRLATDGAAAWKHKINTGTIHPHILNGLDRALQQLRQIVEKRDICGPVT